MDSSTEGVVYFSLGTNIKISQLDNRTLETILNALRNIPYKVLCKFEVDELPERPKNVILKKWMPQQDILGKCGDISWTIINA